MSPSLTIINLPPGPRMDATLSPGSGDHLMNSSTTSGAPVGAVAAISTGGVDPVGSAAAGAATAGAGAFGTGRFGAWAGGPAGGAAGFAAAFGAAGAGGAAGSTF